MRLDPRVSAVVEQLERANAYFNDALSARSMADGWRHLMTSVYYGRSVVEQMRERAKHGGLQVAHNVFGAQLAEMLPRYRLVQAIRIRDFHKEPVTPAIRMTVEVKIRFGPYGQATFSMINNFGRPSPAVETTDPRTRFRFLLFGPGYVQDEKEPVPVPIVALMAEYLGQLPTAIAQYRGLLR